MAVIINKLNSGVMKQFVECSMGNYVANQCSSSANQLMAKNRILLDQWYHRNISDYDELPSDQKSLLNQNWEFMFYPKAVYLGTRTELIRPTTYFNTYNSTLVTVTPARTKTYINSPPATCVNGTFKYNFDSRCRGWYKLAMKNEGLVFYQPYLQISTQEIGVTISQRINDVDDNNLSVLSFNIDIQLMIQNIFAQQEQSSADGYTVFFHTFNKTVFHHRHWKQEDRVLRTWPEVEFNTTYNTFNENDDTYFATRLDEILNQTSVNSVIDWSYNDTISDPFFIQFNKGSKELIALVYPIFVTSRQNIFKQGILKKQNPFYVARVQADIKNLAKEASSNFMKLYLLMTITGSMIMVITVTYLSVHYSKVLISQIDTPLEILVRFLQSLDKSFDLHAKKSRQLNLQKNEQPQQQLQQNQQQQESNVKSSFLQRTSNLHSNTPLLSEDIIQQQATLKYSKGQSIFKHPVSHQSIVSSPRLPPPPQKKNNQYKLQQMHSQEVGTFDSMSLSVAITRGNQKTKFSDHRQSVLNQTPKLFLNPQTSKQELSTSNIFNQPSNITKQKCTLERMDCKFQEMKVIISTFLDLESVISLAMQSKRKGNVQSSLIHFCHAKKIFKKLNNFATVSLCYYNIGALHLSQRNFKLAFESFEKSIFVQAQALDLGIQSMEELCNISKISLDNYLQLVNKYLLSSFSLRLFAENCDSQYEKNAALIRALTFMKSLKELTVKSFQSNYHPSFLPVSIELGIIYLELNNLLECKNSIMEVDSIWSLHFNGESSEQDYILRNMVQVDIYRVSKQILMAKFQNYLGNILKSCEIYTETLETSEVYDVSTRFSILSQLSRQMRQLNLDTSHVQEQLEKFNDSRRMRITFLIEINDFHVYIQARSLIKQIYDNFINVQQDTISICSFGTGEGFRSFCEKTLILNKQHLELLLLELQYGREDARDIFPGKTYTWNDALAEYLLCGNLQDPMVSSRVEQDHLILIFSNDSSEISNVDPFEFINQNQVPNIIHLKCSPNDLIIENQIPLVGKRMADTAMVQARTNFLSPIELMQSECSLLGSESKSFQNQNYFEFVDSTNFFQLVMAQKVFYSNL